jgi:hypothetical protein
MGIAMSRIEQEWLANFKPSARLLRFVLNLWPPNGAKYLPELQVNVMDEHGDTAAAAHKTLYVRRLNVSTPAESPTPAMSLDETSS